MTLRISDRTRLLIVLAIAAAFVAMVSLHTSHLNGPWYWKWAWRDASTIPPVRVLRWFGAMLVAAVPIIVAWILPTRSRAFDLLAIALLMIGVIAIKLVSVSIDSHPPNFQKLANIIRSPDANSYFSDASALINHDSWLADYPQIMPLTSLHTQSKPPGAAAFYMWFIRAFGYGDRAAVIAGITQAILAAFSLA